jgi:uncharacterized protein (TIGR03437 family)
LLNGAQLQYPVLLGGIVNAASGAHSGLSPGSLASIYTLPQAFQPVDASKLPLPTNLDGVTLLTTGGQAPLLAVTPTQINFQVPWDLIPGVSSGSFTLETPVTSYPSKWGIDLTQFSPGIFTMNGQGTGQGAIVIANSSIVAAQTGSFPGSRPAAPGEYVSIFCTGLGPVSNQPANGAPAVSNPLSRTQSAPTVTIGGVPATIEFSGLAPGSVGVNQVECARASHGPFRRSGASGYSDCRRISFQHRYHGDPVSSPSSHRTLPHFRSNLPRTMSYSCRRASSGSIRDARLAGA